MCVDGSQVSAREGPRCFSPSGPAPLVRDCTAFPLPVARSSAASGAFGGAAVTSSPGLSALRASSKILRWPSPTHAAPGSSERSPQTQRPREAPSASTRPITLFSFLFCKAVSLSGIILLLPGPSRRWNRVLPSHSLPPPGILNSICSIASLQ